MEKYVNELFHFIKSSPTPFHSVALIKSILLNFNYEELKENTKWQLKPNTGYFVIRNSASIITFKVGNNVSDFNFNIVASHNDSPTFKIKPNGEISTNSYLKLNTEPYGGMIAGTWLDRALGIAGRVLVETATGVEERLVNLSGHNVVIPSVAIHLNRNGGNELNLQNDTLPVIGLTNSALTLEQQLAKSVIFDEEEKILSHDLFLYTKDEGTTVGLNHELILSPKLDDLECVFSSLEAFLEANNQDNITVCAIFDNEEVGSGSNHGAASTFLTDVLERICQAFVVDKHIAYSTSMMVSADNAHAVHPAHPEKSDPTNQVYLNQGIVIKYHSSLSYTTDALSASIFKALCKRADVPYQDYTNRSDLRGGSTLGRIALEKLSITTIDIGLAQLAMHSAVETAGAKDLQYMVKALKTFYSCKLEKENNRINIK